MADPRRIDLVTQGFEDTGADAIAQACRGWVDERDIDLRVHVVPRSEHPCWPATASGAPSLIHLPHGPVRSAPASLHPASVRVFEREPLDERHDDLPAIGRVVYGRGIKGFKWALRSMKSWLDHPALRVSYGAHRDQHMFVQRPSTSAAVAAPIVFLVHGGFWRQEIDTVVMSTLGAFFASEGYAAVNIEYRRGTLTPPSQTIGDVRDAMLSVAAPTRLPGLDGRRSVVVGHSAGVQIAHTALVRFNDELLAAGVTVRGIVCLAGVTDMVAARQAAIGCGAVQEWLGTSATFGDIRALSPVENPTRTSTLVVHGMADASVPSSMSARYARIAGSHANSRLLLWPGTDHMDVLKADKACWGEVREWIRNRIDD